MSEINICYPELYVDKQDIFDCAKAELLSPILPYVCGSNWFSEYGDDFKTEFEDIIDFQKYFIEECIILYSRSTDGSSRIIEKNGMALNKELRDLAYSSTPSEFKDVTIKRNSLYNEASKISAQYFPRIWGNLNARSDYNDLQSQLNSGVAALYPRDNVPFLIDYLVTALKINEELMSLGDLYNSLDESEIEFLRKKADALSYENVRDDDGLNQFFVDENNFPYELKFFHESNGILPQGVYDDESLLSWYRYSLEDILSRYNLSD